MTLQTEMIPTYLRKKRQWVNWWGADANGELQKAPLNPNGLYNARSDDPSTWGSMDDALANVMSGDVQGVGFMLQPGDDSSLVFLDLDHVRNPETGDLLPLAETLVQRLRTHTHVSPSGTGLHILFLVRGGLPDGGKRRGLEDRASWSEKAAGVEVYDRGRYFTVTTEPQDSALPWEIEDRTEVWNEIYGELFGAPTPPEPQRAPQGATAQELSDADAIARFRRDAKGAALWDGEPELVQQYPSLSEVDFALLLKLAHYERLAWLAPHCEVNDRREKWERSSGGSTHLRRECEKAAERYEANRPARGHQGGGATAELGAAVLEEATIATDGDFKSPAIYFFENGVYMPDGQRFRELVTRIIEEQGRAWDSKRLSEVQKWLSTKVPLMDLEGAPPMHRLNVKNGILDVTTGELLPHSPDWVWPIQLGAKYDPEAECPEIDAFVESIVPPDCVQLVWEILGCLIAPTPGIHRWFVLSGDGRNGKSTFCNLVTRILGGAVSNVSLHDLEKKPFLRDQLIGKLANIGAELPDRKLEQSEILKSITGGDAITVDRKFKNALRIQPFARLLFSTNHEVLSRDTSAGFRHRLVVVPFPNTFPSDPTFEKRLFTEAELRGALRKAIEARRTLLARGDFEIPTSVQEAVDETVALSDSFGVWAQKALAPDPEGDVEFDELSDRYKLHTQYDQNAPQLGRRKMLGRLKQVPGFEGVRERRPGSRGERRVVFSGVRWREPSGNVRSVYGRAS